MSRRSRGSGPASFATMSASETTPRTSSRSPMTGTPEMPCSSRIAATSLSGVSGPTATGSRVMSSSIFM